MQRRPTKLSPSSFSIRRLLSPTDEMLDLTEEEKRRAELVTEEVIRKDDPNAKVDRPSGPSIRRARPTERGLLLVYPLDPTYTQLQLPQVPIGIGISFPCSNSSVKVSYVVNRVWREEEGA